MGWSGGGEIFDCVADELLNLYSNAYDTDIPMYRLLNILSSLYCVLENRDWDNQKESAYWTHSKIGRVLGNTFEEGK